MRLMLRFPNGRNVVSCGIYAGTLFLWIGRAVGLHRSWSLNLNGPSLSHTGAGRWSW